MSTRDVGSAGFEIGGALGSGGSKGDCYRDYMLSNRHLTTSQCMEKGLRTLQTASRTAQRKATADSQSFEDAGTSDHHSDSGIGLGSDAETEVGVPAGSYHKPSSSWPQDTAHQPHTEHVRSRSLPQLLPLYQPPPPIIQRRTFEGRAITISPQDASFQGALAHSVPHPRVRMAEEGSAYSRSFPIEGQEGHGDDGVCC